MELKQNQCFSYCGKVYICKAGNSGCKTDTYQCPFCNAINQCDLPSQYGDCCGICRKDNTDCHIELLGYTDTFTARRLKWFYRYRKVQLTGNFNMILDSFAAAKKASLNMKQYLIVQKYYTELSLIAQSIELYKSDDITYLAK